MKPSVDNPGGRFYGVLAPNANLRAQVVPQEPQAPRLADEGNTVVLVEHEMRIVAATDWVIDMGRGAGHAGGRIVACGSPEVVAQHASSRTAPYLRRHVREEAIEACDPGR